MSTRATNEAAVDGNPLPKFSALHSAIVVLQARPSWNPSTGFGVVVNWETVVTPVARVRRRSLR